MRMPVQCPACNGALKATRLHCEGCGTAIEGEFDLGLGGLGSEDGQFARAFLLARGNLRELERSLGLSYAALRGRLDALVTHLEAQLAQAFGDAPQGTRTGASAPSAATDVHLVLDRLEAGEIEPAEAARLLRAGDATAR